MIQYDDMLDQMDGLVINSWDSKVERLVTWVTKPKTNVFSTPYVAYGNEPGLDYVYANVAFTVDVGPFGNRKGSPISK